MPVKPECPACYSPSTKFYCEKVGYKLYQCLQCKHGFVFPVPTNLKEIYGENYYGGGTAEEHGYVDYDKDKETMRDAFIESIKEIESYTTGRTMFDIGAATGFFLDRAKERGWQTAGSELSDFAGAEARKRGHTMFVGDIQTLNITETYDVVTMWDVFEHVDYPRVYLSEAFKLLKPGGILFINTINITSWWARLFGARWHLILPPEHLDYYSEESLRSLIVQEGFAPLASGVVPKRFNLTYIFRMLHVWQGLSIWKWLAQLCDTPTLSRVKIPANVHDNIYFIAKKR